MNNKLFLGCATAVALSAALLAASPASAAEDATARHQTTDGSIGFYTDNKPSEGPFEKNLSLAYVPTEFDFGGNKSTGVTGVKVYNQVRAADAKQQWLAVSDDREAKANWYLNAKLDKFTAADATTLDNAELSFTVGEAQKYNIDVTQSDKIKSATPNPNEANAIEALGTINGTYALGGTSGVVTLAGDGSTSKNVLKYTAGATADAGTLGVATKVDNVKLTVKDHSNVADKKYTSTVHWNLSDTATD